MEFIENNVVSPGIWNAEWFYELSESGFLAAAHVYETPSGSYAVLFSGAAACFLIDDDTDAPATTDVLKEAIVGLYHDGEIDENSVDPLDFEMLFGDAYQEIGQQGIITDQEMLDRYGFTPEQVKDIQMRMDDVGNYFVSDEEG